MTKRFFCLPLLFIPLIGKTQNNSIQRTVLYTLKKHEVLKSSEFIVQQALNQNRFACVIQDTLNKIETFVFNGKVIFSKPDVWNDIIDIDLSKENGYIYQYQSKNKFFVNVGGKIEGPFDEVTDEACEMSTYFEPVMPNKIDFFYSLAGRWFAYRNGTCQMLDEPPPSKSRGYGSWTTMNIKPNGKKTLETLNGIEVKSTIEIEEVINRSIDGEDYAWVYKNNGSRFVVHGDHIYGPFDDDGYNYIQLSGDNLLYSYKKEGKEYIIVNGIKSEPMDELHYDMALFDNGKYFYHFLKKGKAYANINGKIFGPFDEIPYNGVRFFENGQFAIVYKKEGKANININGKIQSSEASIYSLDFNADGTFSFLINKGDGWVYKNENGVVTRLDQHHVYSGWSATHTGRRTMESSKGNYEILSANKAHKLYTNIKYDYIVIDGKSVGKAPAIKAWFEPAKNTFIWNAWEDKELVVYEYPLD